MPIATLGNGCKLNVPLENNPLSSTVKVIFTNLNGKFHMVPGVGLEQDRPTENTEVADSNQSKKR